MLKSESRLKYDKAFSGLFESSSIQSSDKGLSIFYVCFMRHACKLGRSNAHEVQCSILLEETMQIKHFRQLASHFRNESFGEEMFEAILQAGSTVQSTPLASL